MKIHSLKTWPDPFEAIWDGRKTYEIRVADRPFAVGDALWLREWLPCTCGTSLIPLCGGDRCVQLGAEGDTDRIIHASVTYMTPPGAWGLPKNLCVLGFSVVARIDDSAEAA